MPAGLRTHMQRSRLEGAPKGFGLFGSRQEFNLSDQPHRLKFSTIVLFRQGRPGRFANWTWRNLLSL